MDGINFLLTQLYLRWNVVYNDYFCSQ